MRTKHDFVFVLLMTICSASVLATRYDGIKYFVEELKSQAVRASTCELAGLSRGCCKWSPGYSCYVHGGNCYCDRLCRRYGDCCLDVLNRPCSTVSPTTQPGTTPTVTPPTTPTPTVPPHPCTSLMPSGGGCCEGHYLTCYVPNSMCYCDTACHGRGDCCDDVNSIGCYAQTCQQAGLEAGSCVVDATSNCEVRTGPNTVCYCDSGCTNCCPDATSESGSPGGGSNQGMRMKLLAQLMSSLPSRDWGDTKATNLRRRYQAALVALMQQILP